MSRVEPAASPVIEGRGATSVGIASAVAAAAGYGVLVVTARDLTPAANAEFLVYWSLLFGVFGILGGIQHEVTRAVGERMLLRDPGRGVRVLPWALLGGALMGVLVVVTGRWWGPALLTEQASSAPLVLAACAVLYAGHLAVTGALAGQRRWSATALVVGAESTVRVVLVLVVLVAGWGLAGYEVAAGLAAATWVVAVLLPGVRPALTARSAVDARTLLRGTAHAVVASTGAAALVVGYPTILRATTDAQTWATAAPLVLAISLTRAPLLIPLNAYQTVAISYFLDPRRDRLRALVRVVAVIVGVGVVGAALAAVIGPWLMERFFGPAYRVDGGVLAALTAAAIGLAVLTLTGAGVLALGRHRAYAGGWAVATAVAVAVLLLDLPLAQRAALSLAAGPVAGIVVHGAALLRDRRSRGS